MNSIRRHLTLSLLLGFALLLGVGAVLIYFLSRSAIYSQFDAQLRAFNTMSSSVGLSQFAHQKSQAIYHMEIFFLDGLEVKTPDFNKIAIHRLEEVRFT